MMTESIQFMELQSIPPLAPRRPSQLSNYSYPRSNSPIYFIPQHEARRGSTGSECSMPGMIEDQGSEVSTEDDYQSHATGADLWDSFWQARVHEELGGGRLQYPALLNTPRPPHEPVLANKEVEQATRDRAESQTSQESTWPLPLKTSPNKRPTKATPRTSYSLFPSTNDCTPIQPTTPPRRASLPKQSSELDSRSTDLPIKTGKLKLEAEQEMVTEPAEVSKYIRRPLPATPRPQRTTMITAATLNMKPLPKTPDQRRRSARRVSGVNQHRRSISKTPTKSLPSLSSTMPRKAPTSQNKLHQSQSQIFLPSALPREVERQPPPPHVSVFEFSDDEDEDDGSNSNGLARRLVRGLTHHRNRSGTVKERLANHQRSASHSPSSSTAELNKAGATGSGRDRAGTIGSAEIGSGQRPSTASEGSSDRARPQSKEGRSRPWLSRQGSELFLGRLLGRRGS